MTAARLDAGTLRVVIAELQRDLDEGHPFTAEEALRNAIEDMRVLATEAEARPADLADWIAAATRSKLGAPLSFGSEGQTLFVKWPGLMAKVENGVCLIVRPGAVGLLCARPAMLTAWLDRVASERTGALP